MQQRRKFWLALFLKLIVTAACLTLAFSPTEVRHELVPHLRLLASNWIPALAGLLAVALSILCAAWRWQLVLSPYRLQIPYGETLRVTIVSWFFQFASLGAAASLAYKAFYFSNKPEARAAILTSIMMDYFAGLLALVLVFWPISIYQCLLTNALPDSIHHALHTTGLISLGLLLAACLITVFCRRHIPPAAGSASPRKSSVQYKLQKMREAFHIMRQNWPNLAASTAVSIPMTLAYYLTFYFALQALGSGAPLIKTLGAMPIVDTIASLPISLSGLGVREKTFEFLMAHLAGIPAASAVSASLLAWLLNLSWGLVGAVIFLKNPKHKSFHPYR